MDSIQLAQTLVNVATNLMEQQQQQQFRVSKQLR